ncbi:MAG: transcriptional regulator BetI [Alphaproteobacteria bacterium]|jgi:TetR/AcrR family transcriptional regulator, transcriptional repressor of bet genes|nr:transcriptional regulator BetI [Rhodospirillaceae bacterium]MBT6510548.1 transcriptional regulator BetI [Rhodospirillaceae bacterium]MBT7615631.1 transcriptional regulator BetI [Rhodospirillaceae bacterium]MBT7645456.1 transcriptional regulator BetI [Rhodospirillaceae bacterium]MDG2481471.1 transcriptional regulator BetI [Alphaproteobacteria bacterium]
MPKVGMEPVRRKQLIEATITSIHQDGFQDATVARISRRAGLSVGLVNHYFDGKDDLLEATMQTLVDMTLADVEAGIDPRDRPLDRLMGYMQGHFAPGQRSPEAISAWLSFYAQVSERESFSGIQAAFDQALFDLLRPILAELVAPNRVEGIAQTIVSLVYGLWLRHAHDPEGFDLDMIHAIAREYVHGVVVTPGQA